MSMLSDRDIRLAMTPAKMAPNLRHRDPLRIVPEPSDDCIQSSSVDLRLDNEFIYWHLLADEYGVKGYEKVKVVTNEWLLEPGQFILASTLEFVAIPDWLAAQVDGKSTLGRQGVPVHMTAGFIDAGFQGKITLEIKNLGYEAIPLTAGMKICQLILHKLSSPALRPYGHPDLGSKYQFQAGVTDAR